MLITASGKVREVKRKLDRQVEIFLAEVMTDGDMIQGVGMPRRPNAQTVDEKHKRNLKAVEEQVVMIPEVQTEEIKVVRVNERPTWKAGYQSQDETNPSKKMKQTYASVASYKDKGGKSKVRDMHMESSKREEKLHKENEGGKGRIDPDLEERNTKSFEEQSREIDLKLEGGMKDHDSKMKALVLEQKVECYEKIGEMIMENREQAHS